MKRWKLNTQDVHQASAAMSDRERSAVRWVHGHATDANLTLQEMASMIKKSDGSGYDPNTLYKIMTGKHDASLNNFVESVERLRPILEERDRAKQAGFVETNLSKRIWKCCHTARVHQTINFIFGESQIGKTTALMEYTKAHNHGSTIYVRCPAGGGMKDFLRECCKSLKLGKDGTTYAMRESVITSMDSTMLLILDEAHQLLPSWTGKQSRLAIIEYVREIHDRTGCGVVLAATNVFRAALEGGRDAGWLRQLDLRSMIKLPLPDLPSQVDLATFAEQYGLPQASGAAKEIQNSVVREHGLGRWIKTLKMASHLAANKKQELTWDVVISAHAGRQNLERGEG